MQLEEGRRGLTREREKRGPWRGKEIEREKECKKGGLQSPATKKERRKTTMEEIRAWELQS